MYIYNVYDMIGEIKPFPGCLLCTGSRLKTIATDRRTPPKKKLMFLLFSKISRLFQPIKKEDFLISRYKPKG